MAKGNKKSELIVKNQKFKKSDILAFGICLIVALVIWVYAINVEMKEQQEPESVPTETETTQQA